MENGIKKIFSCKCGRNSLFEFASELEVEDITISARCPGCGTSVMITLSSMLKKSERPASISEGEKLDEGILSESESVSYESISNENVNEAIRELFG